MNDGTQDLVVGEGGAPLSEVQLLARMLTVRSWRFTMRSWSSSSFGERGSLRPKASMMRIGNLAIPFIAQAKSMILR
ncbi:hypothetical protein [Ralstonia solanacearum]|uniref:hypothetical protein n=1 Tax=Ralstonia solanacearum TaxID=305 RepID=UPI0013C2E296|nr:hypothetical protein [Ralstonia solanacearum]